MATKTTYQQWADGERSGEGSFHTALFNAYRLADDDNRMKLEYAFPSLFRNRDSFNPEEMLSTAGYKAEFSNMLDDVKNINSLVVCVIVDDGKETICKGGIIGRFNAVSALKSTLYLANTSKSLSERLIAEGRDIMLRGMKGGDDE